MVANKYAFLPITRRRFLTEWEAFKKVISKSNIRSRITIPLQQLNGLATLVIIMVANKYSFLQITRRRFLNEWEAFKKVRSRRNIRMRITRPLTLCNLIFFLLIPRPPNSPLFPYTPLFG